MENYFFCSCIDTVNKHYKNSFRTPHLMQQNNPEQKPALFLACKNITCIAKQDNPDRVAPAITSLVRGDIDTPSELLDLIEKGFLTPETFVKIQYLYTQLLGSHGSTVEDAFITASTNISNKAKLFALQSKLLNIVALLKPTALQEPAIPA